MFGKNKQKIKVRVLETYVSNYDNEHVDKAMRPSSKKNSSKLKKLLSDLLNN